MRTLQYICILIIAISCILVAIADIRKLRFIDRITLDKSINNYIIEQIVGGKLDINIISEDILESLKSGNRYAGIDKFILKCDEDEIYNCIYNMVGYRLYIYNCLKEGLR